MKIQIGLNCCFFPLSLGHMRLCLLLLMADKKHFRSASNPSHFLWKKVVSLFCNYVFWSMLFEDNARIQILFISY